ncbi:Bis(5'-nucleosyl)-tetraphosphatase, symmetrical [Fusarium oxysporum f. sp. albedinis]|nr:Bis(5'-nucleosyl)-tetraphosphatase, symmetrical [Fusarium oxysporum f. sp. albedinis]
MYLLRSTFSSIHLYRKFGEQRRSRGIPSTLITYAPAFNLSALRAHFLPTTLPSVPCYRQGMSSYFTAVR